jgi:GNAT superfamily N-acetyltransferase
VDLALVRDLETRSDRAWPSLRAVPVGGWIARSSAGASRRGNSVWTRGEVDDLAGAIGEVERFYGDMATPPTFQMTPSSRPAGLVAALEGAGYADVGATDVCVLGLAELAALADPGGLAELGSDGTSGGATGGLVVGDRPDGGWLSVVDGVLATFGTAQRDGSLAVLGRLAVPQRYVVVTVDGRAVAAGRGVLDGDWLGIYSMATLPAARGRGAAVAVLAELGRWAAGAGATRAYLQVERTSTAARRLYTRLGFRSVYAYSYRRRPDGR